MSYSPDARLIAGMLDALIKKVDKTNELLQILLSQRASPQSFHATKLTESIDVSRITVPELTPVRLQITEKTATIRERERETERERFPPTPPLKEKEKEKEKENAPLALFPSLMGSLREETTPGSPQVSLAVSTEIIEYLNHKTGNKFRSVPAYRKLIKARIKEGYTLIDFKKVIDNMTEAWGNEEKMKPYLRPATLFTSKFQSYLDWRPDAPRNTENGRGANGRYVESSGNKSKYAGIEEVIEI